jgi:hypothetical protein
MRKEGEENESSLEGNNGMKIRMTIMGTIIHAISIIKEYQEELYWNVIMKRIRYKFLTPRFDYWKRILIANKIALAMESE